MLNLNLKSYRRLSIDDKESIKQKVLAEIRAFPKTPPKRDLTAHLCLLFNLSFTLAQMFIMIHEQASIPAGGIKRIGVNEYVTLSTHRRNHLKHAIFNYYRDNFGSTKMSAMSDMASQKFNVSRHLVKKLAPKRNDIILSRVRLPCGNII